jgi:hypothetical protein
MNDQAECLFKEGCDLTTVEGNTKILDQAIRTVKAQNKAESAASNRGLGKRIY